jgi:hypothetical protein
LPDAFAYYIEHSAINLSFGGLGHVMRCLRFVQQRVHYLGRGETFDIEVPAGRL